jgi:NAD(P)-dependent dehydrogenase (short-subunit alcohol dehydrogenase family)
MRIASPPTDHSCFYGVDTPERSKLLAARMDLEAMADYIQADSLAFVSIDGLYRAVGDEKRNKRCPQFCDACFTGEYPTRLTDYDARAASWKRRNEAAGRPIALVTGASRGIGAATAQALAAGAHVIVTARDAKALEGVEQAIHEAGGTATIAPMDLTETDAIARLAKAVAERWGKLDVLVVNAGVLPRSPRHRYRPQGLQPRHRHQHAGNPGPAHQLRSAAAQGGGGRVIGLTTSVATKPRAFWGAYAATKAAQEVLLDCYAQEVGNISPVKVAIVDPGATRTAMRARAYPGEDPMSLKTPDVVAGVALLGEDFASPHRIRV